MKRVLDWFYASCEDLYFWLRRRDWPVPKIVRNIVREVLSNLIDKKDLVPAEDWSVPLIRRSDGEIADGSVPSGRSAGLRADEGLVPVPSSGKAFAADVMLRCAIINGVSDIGGLDKVAKLLARSLPSFGLKTTTIIPSCNETPHDEPVEDECSIVRLSERNAQRWFRECRPDVISAHGAPDWLIAAAAENNIPIVETLHGAHTFFDTTAWPQERTRSKQIQRFIAVSELTRRQYLNANPSYPPAHVITIPNGVDDRYARQCDRSDARAWLGLRNEFLFISLARYHVQKNTYGLVQAFSELTSIYPDVHLLVAGHVQDVAYYEQVRRLRDRLPGADRVHLRGNSELIPQLLAASDAFVLDSFFEGWALASMEALCAGLPVVLSDVGGAREQVGEGGSRGIVVDNPLGSSVDMDWNTISRLQFSSQANKAALVNGMSSVVAARDRWSGRRQELREESLSRFSADRCVELHSDVLKSVATKKTRNFEHTAIS